MFRQFVSAVGNYDSNNTSLNGFVLTDWYPRNVYQWTSLTANDE